MRKRLLSILLLCCMVLTLLPTAAFAAGDVKIDETNFPDEKFREYVKTKFDKDNNNSLSADEIAAVKEISVEGKPITSFKGIEYFTALTSLECSNTKLTSLDTSHNKKLGYLRCNYIQDLTTLNVSQNTELKGLYCNDNALTALDLTNNSALETLECGDNELTTLDLSKNTELKYFGCFNSKLSSLDLTNNTNLEELHFAGNNVSTLDVSKNTNLKKLRVFSNQLLTLDTSKNTNLQVLEVQDNPLTSMCLGDSGPTIKEVIFLNRPYPIEVSAATKTFDLSTLPAGFDVTKASSWVGGKVNENTLTVDANASTVTYTYDCGERQATYGTPAATGKLMLPCTLQINWENAPDALTGTVKIIGELKYGKKIYFDVTDSNEDGGLRCKWYREGEMTPLSDAIEYELVEADIGKKITCVVSGTTKTGTIETTVGPVKKADGPAAPVLELDFRSIDMIKVKHLGNTYEYRIDNEEWQDLHYFENLQPGKEYTITARAKETATHKPGAVSKPLTVATLFNMIPDALKDKLTAVVSAYKAEYDGKEHEAVIVDTTNMPEGWSIAGHTAGTGDDFVSQIPKIRNVSGSNLTVKTKFTHPDYGQSLIVYSYPEITPKPVTAGMIADIPSQHYTGKPIQPTPKIKDGDMPLKEGADFTYSYDTNTSSEQGGKVTITGKGNYKDMASKSFNIVNEITEITEDDLKDLEIPTLVTVKCTTTNSSKEYGRIPGGFDLSKKPYMENGVWKAIVQLNLSAYWKKYNADTKKTHEIADLGGNLVTTFTLKYVNHKWELDGNFPNVVILVKCDGQHPQTPPYPTEENVSGLGDQIVAVLCNNVPAGQQSGKYYGLIGGGFTSTTPMLNADKVYESTITLIPSAYCNQFSGDTGIMHKVLSTQTTDGLKFVVKYDSAKKMWKPAEGVKQMAIWVTCEKHETDTPVPTEFTITFNGNGGTPSVGSMRTANQKLTSLPTATHSGRYSFDGWYTAASGGTKITTATVFYENTTVYAHWTYIGGGGSSGGGGGYTYHTIRAISGLNGSVSPSGWTSVRHGWDQTFTITPDKGYAVAKVLVDGKSVGSVKSYTFKNVTKDHTIEVVFMKANGNPQTGVFVDVAEGSYYEEAVDWAVKNGITTGTGSNYFTPDGICTRAQAVTFLWRVAGSPTPKTEAMVFEDVLDGSYYYEAVLWAVENGITVGTSATTFSPELTCSRAHIVTFLWRAANSPSVKTDNPFTDVAADAYYIDAVLWAVKHKITAGTTLSTFSPDEGCTRAQIVTFLYRAHSK